MFKRELSNTNSLLSKPTGNSFWLGVVKLNGRSLKTTACIVVHDGNQDSWRVIVNNVKYYGHLQSLGSPGRS